MAARVTRPAHYRQNDTENNYTSTNQKQLQPIKKNAGKAHPMLKAMKVSLQPRLNTDCEVIRALCGWT
jgi:hypothetical protein